MLRKLRLVNTLAESAGLNAAFVGLILHGQRYSFDTEPFKSLTTSP